jgi:parallel beta-helix repeat protein
MRGLVLQFAALAAVLSVPTQAANGSTRVKAGQSIQAAIDAASAGDQIVVEAGEYRELLTVSKNGVRLVAKNGAVLLPPSTAPLEPNACAGLAGDNTAAGICVVGKDVELAPYTREHRKVISVGSYVEDVLIQGFDVRGFHGLNIAIVGARNAEVRGNTVSDGTAYGILTAGSISTLITRNTVKASELMFIGICMDDESDVSVTQNKISEYGIGLCVQTHGADVGHNKVTNCCFGALVDPLTKGARLTHNKFGPSNAACVPNNGVAAAGITIAGAIDTEVHRNEVTGTNDGGNPESFAPGILVYDDALGPAVNNHITFNTLSNNEPDIADFSTGSNEIRHNKCSPSGGCA